MALDSLFLGWDQPCLHAAVDELVRRFGREGILDLEKLIVVLPGARAGRRLIELLVERAERERLALIPPLTMTPGELPEYLYVAARPAANDVARLLAWVDALKAAEPDELAKLFPRRPATDDFDGWAPLARICQRLHSELAGEMLTFGDVASRGAELTDFNEHDRWTTLETARRLYLAKLDELGLADRDAARIAAVERRECRTEKTIVLLATPELNRVVRRMLQQVTTSESDQPAPTAPHPEPLSPQAGRGEQILEHPVSVWVFAPEELAVRFDELGCTVVEAWRDATIELRIEQVEIVERPSDQAAAVLGTIAGYGGRFAPSQITVGVPDEEVVAYIEQQFELHGLVAHHAAGLPIERTGPFRLLEVAADYIEHRRTADFAALARHPDVETWLRPHVRIGDAITELDEFSAERLPASLQSDAFHSAAGIARVPGVELRGTSSEPPGTRTAGGSKTRPQPPVASLLEVQRRVEEWLKGLAGSGTLGLANWAEPLLELVLVVYGDRTLDRTDAADHVVIQSCEAVHGVLQQFHGLDVRVSPVVDAATALRLALELAASTKIAPVPRREAIELVGWLELALDDAPAIIVTGFNEGLVPDSINADAFLPNHLRTHLKLLDNDRRYVRDAYSLAAILDAGKGVGSLLPERPEGCSAQKTPDPFFRSDVKLIAGRRTADFEPRTPSRLLFACDDAEIARRVPQFFPESAGAEKGVRNLLQKKVPDTFFRSRFDIPRPAPTDPPITSMRVTSFRDYLACPYRFYLRHVLGLEAIDEPNEIPASGFGNLAHAVLSRFGNDSIKDSTDADAIRAFLNVELDRLVDESFGRDPVPAVRVQVEQLRLRLDAFADWQAQRRRDGWRIDRVELEIGGDKAPFDVDGKPMFLRGRIDRIDRHDDGRCCVLDYKTGDAGVELKDAVGSDNTWRDLQLPLYRHLVRAAGIADEVQLGYIALPRDPKGVGEVRADWTPEQLAVADDTARRVIRDVRAGRFDDIAKPPPRGFDEFAWICQESRTAPLLEADEEDEP